MVLLSPTPHLKTIVKLKITKSKGGVYSES